MKAKVYLVLSVDEDDFPVPADENIAEDIEDSITTHVFDIDGVKLRSIKVTMEKTK